tara:strand:+ start:1834 stop:2058 length:225 start_codon:yes stop_codon:yes gene_type:complete
MGFKAGKIVEGKVDLNAGLPSLSQEELLYLLQVLGNSKFDGKDVEKVFNLTLKLQQIYLYYDKKYKKKKNGKNS